MNSWGHVLHTAYLSVGATWVHETMREILTNADYESH